MLETIDYTTPGRLTDLSKVRPSALDQVTGEAIDICRPVHNLIIQPSQAKDLGVPSHRFYENQVRPVDTLIDALLFLDSAPLNVPRDPGRRVIGTCRHYAVMSCALLRHRGIGARARCGFATYFQPGRGVDHWIIEYWSNDEGRWVRVDSEVLDQSIVTSPDDLGAGEFLTGGEAWIAFREGRIDAGRFGVCGTENWGPAEIRGNAIRDLAALNKVEMLPWDEWGRMDASYKGETGPDYDELLDAVAGVCASADPPAVARLYGLDELRVPDELIC